MRNDIIKGLIFTGCVALSAAGAVAQTSGQVEQQPSNLPDDYLKNLKNYEFVNTRGMRDLNPNRIPWIPENRQDPDNWDFPTAEERSKLDEMGINFPDFNFIEGGELDAGQRRQKTHTMEHIIYAMPGDAVSLYPYYGLEEYTADGQNFLSTRDYLETFSHWYDYKSGGRVIHTAKDGKKYDLLDFPHDRGYMQITDNYGFYGGIYMSPGTNAIPNQGTKYTVSNAQEYIDAVHAINDAGGTGRILLTTDIDFTGRTDVPMLGADAARPFVGTLDGNGHSIKNLRMEGTYSVGLVSNAGDGASIYNLVLDNCTISGYAQIGLVGYLNGGGLTVKNLKINDNCFIYATGPVIDGNPTESFTGSILGRCNNGESDNHLTVENVYVGGRIGNSANEMGFNTAICGWLNTRKSATPSIFKNIVVNCNLIRYEQVFRETYVRHSLGNEPYQDAGGKWIENGQFEDSDVKWSMIFENCYGNHNHLFCDGREYDDPMWTTFNADNLPDMTGWFEIISTEDPNLGAELLATAHHRPWLGDEDGEEQKRRKAGTSAVFYFPEFLEDEWNEEAEYVIAADFSQTFYPDANHINVNEKQIIEPLIAFRHIFRIRDARRQTEELQNHNSDYTRKHQHRVTARVGSDFRIRLDSPLPTGWGTSGGVTNYYFKNGAGKYERVRRFGIKVLDGADHSELPGEQGFTFGSDIRMRRAHSSPFGDYSDPEGPFLYHSMLRKGSLPSEKHYIVQVIAKDNNGNVIRTADGDMVLMQYDINFVSSGRASLVTEDELYNVDNRYRHARDEYLKERYGDTKFKIDFDNFFALNKLPDGDLKSKMISYSVAKFGNDIPSEEHWYWNEQKDNLVIWDHYSGNHLTSNSKMQHTFYKWPVVWESSTYGFGYNYRYNYNMYMLATHTTNVPYHASADREENRAKNIDNEIGLYDRLYYKTKRLREASPEKKIKQEQGYFYYVNAASDPGVSARLNVDLPCAGSRVIVSAWIAELTKGAENDGFEAADISFNFVAVMKENKERVVLHNFITGNIPADKLGKWCNVYYSFIPRMSEFYNDTKTFEDVDHFELELAHNGESSIGADYAIDDIRAYVVPSTADAVHEGFACADTPLDIKIETSFETLIEKLGKPEGYGDTDEKLNLYYAIVDKEKFDETGSMNDAMLG
ncbi:MAG: hypothetical protein K2H18_06275, partial [Muribaculaceae bacterium]|nr:hypothetical protein [Muribaculaceae bacterium]